MKPHELVNALFEQKRREIPSVSALARAIHNQGFQGTLHKFLAGQVPHPTASTATRIAKFFDLPMEALYDARVATRIARERGLTAGTTQPGKEPDEDTGTLERANAQWPFRSVTSTQVSNLSPAARAQLERLIAAYIGGPLPSGAAPDQWREIAHRLARNMDYELRREVYTAFVRKVDELAAENAVQPRKPALTN